VLPRALLPFLLLLMSSSPARVGADAACPEQSRRVRPATPSEAKGSVPVPDFVYTAAKSYEPLAWLHGADRFTSGATILIRESNKQRPLVPTFAASADPTISFDTKRVLFAGKAHATDPWQIWEVPLSNSAPRRITSGPEDCIRPFYLPEDRVVYARKIAGRFVIEVVDLSGGKPLALTYIPGNALPTDVLRDGRILFEAGYPLGANTVPELYTVYSDGSGVESYRCDHGAGRHSARQNSSGDIIFTSAQGLGRFTSARATELHLPVPAGEFSGDFAQGAAGDWLISWRPDAKAPFHLMRWTPGSPSLQPMLAPGDSNELQPAILVERAVPNRHPSGLHDWPNANLLCLNAYTSKYHFPPGSIHDVRLYTRNTDGEAKLLGSAPVERDGSFFVQVPTEQPLQIELLDSTGKTLKREAGFFWMRHGEQRVCVGCHAGPETAPDNAVPMILLKSTAPADMTGASAAKAAGGQ
jgi:hypothetical protein